MPAAIRAVFFDAVGTVIHPAPSAPEVYARVAADLGLTLSAAEVRTRFVAAFRAEEAIDRAAGWVTSEAREEARWRRIVADTLPGGGDECFRTLYEHFARPTAWAVDPAAAAAFTRLRSRGLTVGLASNYDRRLESVIAGHAAMQSLEPIVISSQVGHRKPGGPFFAAALDRVGLSPREVLFVGDDRDNDYQGALAVGLKAVLLDPQNRHPDVKARIASMDELMP